MYLYLSIYNVCLSYNFTTSQLGVKTAHKEYRILFPLQISTTRWLTCLMIFYQIKPSPNLKLAHSRPNLKNLFNLPLHLLSQKVKHSLKNSNFFSFHFSMQSSNTMFVLFFAHQLKQQRNQVSSHLMMKRTISWMHLDLTVIKTIPRKKRLLFGPTRKGNSFVFPLNFSLFLLSLFIVLN